MRWLWSTYFRDHKSNYDNGPDREFVIIDCVAMSFLLPKEGKPKGKKTKQMGMYQYNSVCEKWVRYSLAWKIITLGELKKQKTTPLPPKEAMTVISGKPYLG